MTRSDHDAEYRFAENKEMAFWNDPKSKRQVANILYADPEGVDWARTPDYDLVVHGLKYEAKLRWPPHYNDVLIETSHSDGNRGWLFHSSADRLLYLWIEEDFTIRQFLIYDLKGIQRDWKILRWMASDVVQSFKNMGRYTTNKVFQLETLRKYEL